MILPFLWIDTFADRVFSGNPAGVVPLAHWLPDDVMQQIACENGLAETAFFVRTSADRFHLRWFTPAIEIDLCGHATLAAAFALFNQLGQAGHRVVFDSRSGPLPVALMDDGLIELNFPATPPTPGADAAATRAVAAALGQTPRWLGHSKFDLFAVLPDAASVRAVRPDLAQVAAAGRRGLIVTAPGGEDCDFVSRFFAPQSGVPEDPVTGSAHCALAPYWAARIGKTVLQARQVSARGGRLCCTVAGDRVKIAGRAVLYLRGELNV
ncbi:MAG: PhzF family phenazine biosynthesis protein [Opitutaceae bacterium]|nr:PhzF family phenazine biosynthesis protein [Opitutaceae bacterium]